MKKILVLWAVMILAVSCAPFSKNIMDQVDPTLTFDDVLKNPSAFQGKTVIWGGVIVETINRPNETVIKVRQTDLDIEKRPMNVDRSRGRFLIQYNGFLDPAIYAPGRQITVIGEVRGKIVQKIRDLDYSYPLIESRESQLWRPETLGSPFFHFGIGIGGGFR